MDSLKLEPGEVLYTQGDAPQHMGLLLDGSLLVSTQAPDASELVLARVVPGQVIGEMGLLDAAPRSATVRCDHSATLLVLDQTRFEQLLESADPRGMAERIGQMNTRIAEAAVDPGALEGDVVTPGSPSGGLRAWLQCLWGRP
jgi:CRP-like cAMP-binding protein